jgi:hypothetical protein
MRDYDKGVSLELVKNGKATTVRYFPEDGVVIRTSGRQRIAYLVDKEPTDEELFLWVTKCALPIGAFRVRHYLIDFSHKAKRLSDGLLYPNGVRMQIFPELMGKLDVYLTKGDTYLEEFTVTPRHTVDTMDDAIAELAHRGVL